MLSDDAKAMRKLSLMISSLMAIVLVLGINIGKIEVFGIDLTVDQRQLLVLLLCGNLYASVYFSLLAARDQRVWLQTYDLAGYRTRVAEPALKAYGALIGALEDSRKLSREGRHSFLWLFRLVRTAHATGSNLEQSYARTYTEEEKAALEQAIVNGSLPTDQNLNDATLMMLVQKHIYGLVNQLASVEPEIAARIEAALYDMQMSRAAFVAETTDGAMRRWPLGWAIAYLPVITASFLILLSIAAILSPGLGPSIVDFLSGMPTPDAPSQ